jgi:hypothetical protein
MERKRSMTVGRRASFAFAALAMTLASVGGNGISHAAEKTQVVTGRKQLPPITVTDILSAQPFSLESVAAGKPTMLWFWAPS